MNQIEFPVIFLVLPYEKIYLEHLPDADCYEKSYMHRDVITHLVVTKTDFIITGSIDGHIKFWKKMEEGIEFVKHFRSHLSKYWQKINKTCGRRSSLVRLFQCPSIRWLQILEDLCCVQPPQINVPKYLMLSISIWLTLLNWDLRRVVHAGFILLVMLFKVWQCTFWKKYTKLCFSDIYISFTDPTKNPIKSTFMMAKEIAIFYIYWILYIRHP